ncbi:Diacetylchitobiose uptake system permease protein NgcG [Thermoflexales bacterium]|nr:Diacetylchitobiose uptake system permease protein NgcG [Thermoflexales bacterium]
MKPAKTPRRLRNWPVHVLLIGLCLVWLVPAFGLLVTSFRPFQAVNDSGWWTVLSAPKGQAEYEQNCAACHGPDGRQIAAADLTNPELVQNFRRSFTLIAALKKDINDQPHMGTTPVPNEQAAADIATYLRRLSGIDAPPRFTVSNYVDALVGYRGERTYEADCAAAEQALDLNCDASDLGNPRGMGRAFLNSILVTLPATILPILFAAFAAYAFAWLHFPMRTWIFALLVGLQVVPLQMTLIPISRLYAQLGLNGTFPGIWLFHMGFGLPYAIYLMRNFLGSLPRDLFESAYIDGADHWTAFWRLAVPLAIPAVASLAIFQFLWVWNDLLVALVFLGGQNPVMTYQISNMVTSLGGGWHLLTAAAFLSMALPMIIFFALQRFFVRGMLAGSVKG